MFQSEGTVSVKAAPEAGGLMVQVRSVVRRWLKQISSSADEIVRSVQFWLSQLTVMPVPLLSGIPLPELSDWVPHKLLESQTALVDGLLGGVEGEPPPPQLANSVVSVSKALVQRIDRMQCFAGLREIAGPRCGSGVCTESLLSTVCQILLTRQTKG